MRAAVVGASGRRQVSAPSPAAGRGGPDGRESWQRSAWVQWLAIAVGWLPGFLVVMIMQGRGGGPLSLREGVWYSTVLGASMVVVMLLVLRFLCGESIRGLNQQTGTWRRDALLGVGLAAVTLGTQVLLAGPVSRLLPSAPDNNLGSFFDEMVASPWAFALVLGPMLVIGAAVYEELARVFLLTRLWNLSPGRAWRWAAVLLSAVLFGVVHLYQGPAGAVMAGLSGLLMAAFYLRFGRIAPMMLAHYLHDAVQFTIIYLIATS
jgi:membrane protease YdiL (CAAX protease family)